MEAIDKLRKEMALRKYAYNSINTYCDNLRTIIMSIGENPSIDQIKDYLLTIKNFSYHKQIVATIHRYFEFVLKQPLSLKDIPYPRKQEKLIEVFSVEEIKLLFSVIHNLKHKAIVSLLYGCGLRVSEVLNLKASDIDSKRMVINIRQSKGNKDRQVPLYDTLLKLLREYWIQYKPKEFMFNGQFGNVYSASSINQFLKYYSKRVGIKKRIHAHLLRHCYAVHMIEMSTDMSILQKIMGHNNIKTTQHYAKLSTALISKTKSPLSGIYA